MDSARTKLHRIGLACALVVGLWAGAGDVRAQQAPVVTHPLDGLSSSEIERITQLLRDAGHATDATRFALIELIEPPKAQVRAWRAGEALPRKAQVHLREQGRFMDAVVDLSAGKVERIEPLTGQPMLLLEEFLGSMELALGDERFRAGLAKRGLAPEDVFCLPLTAGNFPGEDNAGRRMMKVPCYVNPTGSNFYAKPIEGLFATVDIERNEVLEVVDEGVLPVPEDAWGYTEEEIEKRTGALRPPSTAARLALDGEPGFRIDGSAITWDIWRFRYRTDKRPGVVLSAIEVKDGDRWREVLYQAHLSEVFVPYSDPSPGWYWRTYMDSGEYGFGIFMSPLRRGVDCPETARFLPAVMHGDDGKPVEIPDAICVFERDIGDPAWRHFEVFAQSATQSVPAEGRPDKQLVVRSASEVGNYDYLIDYVFRPNGRVDIQIGSTGLDAVKGVASRSMKDATAAADTRWGTLIAPYLVAPNHDHYFNFRLDFDIDGVDNTFMRSSIVRAPLPQGVPRRSLWEVKSEMAHTEKAGRYRLSTERPAMYHVMNMNVESALGHHPGYMIAPENSVAYGPYDFEADAPMKRNAYIEYTIWNTLQDPGQRYAGGRLAFASDGSDSLPAWVERDRPIMNADIVTWYTIGFHHVPHMEDWPVMSTMWRGISLMPFNFFAMNPAATLRLPSPR